MIIEIRPIIERRRLKLCISSLKRELGLEKAHRVPHITLVYNFESRIQPYELAKIIQKIARNYNSLNFEYAGWELKEGIHGYVFAIKIIPSRQLMDFRFELYNGIKNFIIENTEAANYNKPLDKFWFHAAIAFHLNKSVANRIDRFINKKPTLLQRLFRLGNSINNSYQKVHPLFGKSAVLRITLLLDNRHIAYEYDTLQDRILNRQEALSTFTKNKIYKYIEI